MRAVPNLNLSGIGGAGGIMPKSGHMSGKLGMDTKRVNGERGFLLDFFEKFHDEHEELKEIATFTKEEFFKASYMIEALAVGLPDNFVCAAD